MVAAQSNVAKRFEDDLLVDTDVHISSFHPEVRKAVAAEMDEPYSRYVSAGLDSSNALAGAPVQHSGWAKTLGGKKDTVVAQVADGEDVKEQVRDAYGVDYAILNTEAQPDQLTKTEHALQEARAYNNVLLDRFLDGYDNHLGLCSVAAREPEEAAEEIDRMGSEKQVVGVYFWAGHEYQLPLGDPHYDVMYRAMEDNDLTPVYHTAMVDRHFPVLRKMEKFTSVLNLNAPYGLMLTLTSLVNNGVPEKFPDLDFVVVEGGIGWVPYMMSRMNRNFGEWRAELPLLEKSPEEYIRDSFYFSTQPIGEFRDAEHMVKTMEILGLDSLVFSTDHPHHDFDNPATIDDLLRRFPAEDREKVLHGNAIDAFDLAI